MTSDSETTDQPLRALTREQVRRVDQYAIRVWGMTGLVLMENAGRGAADVLCELGVDGTVLVACFRGNNGGDGFVLARHLNLRGCQVEVVLCCPPNELRGDAATNHAILAKTDVPIHAWDAADVRRRLESADWIIDALLGTGSAGDPRSPLDRVIEDINRSPAKKMAIDVPSGLDCDTAAPGRPTVRADQTCSFVAPKPGLLAESARDYVGRLHVLDIGVPWKLVVEALTTRPARTTSP
jgi:NAD(P)H-hydrate epimerase